MRKALGAALFFMTTTSCGPPQSILHPGGPAARNLAVIGWVVFILLGAIALVMWLLLLWTVLRRRGTLEEHEPYNEGGGQKWIFVGGLAIPLVFLCGLFVFALERMTDFPSRTATSILRFRSSDTSSGGRCITWMARSISSSQLPTRFTFPWVSRLICCSRART